MQSANETFYDRFYGFNRPPFHITPDPAMLFGTETHRQALAALQYGIAAGKGFIVLTGEVGVGKTTLLRACIDGIVGTQFKVIYLFDPRLTVAELYGSLLEELGSSVRVRSVAGLLRELHKQLLAAHQEGIRVVIAVDEAQNMPEQTLECLRMLSNLETSTSKLIQIVLVGQPELDDVLSRHSLRQLAQRIAVRASIKPLTARQSRRYIRHRLECAGRTGRHPLFTWASLWYIGAVARGIPRSINICCDNALITGFGLGAERINLRVAMEACRPVATKPPVRFMKVAVASAIVLCGAFGLAHLDGFSRTREQARSGLASLYQGSKELRGDIHRGAVIPALTAVMPAVAPASAPVANALSPTPVTVPAAAAVDSGPLAPPMLRATDPEPSDVTAAGMTKALAPVPSESAIPATAVAEATPSAQAATANAADRPSGWMWRVRTGDTLGKVCQATYGVCGALEIHELLVRNPKIGRDMRINVGQIILLPDPLQPNAANANPN